MVLRADTAAAGTRHIRSFHPRRGRVTPTQRDALGRLWPRYGFEVDGQPLDLEQLFGSSRPVVLEVGSGMGEAALSGAAADPGTNVLAVDVHTPGLGQLLHHIERGGLDNVRVGRGDAVELVRDMLPARSLDSVQIFFPDPWPKPRHHKRRLVQPEFVALVADRLRVGGVLHVATDWPPYAEQILRVLAAEPGLRNLHEGFAPQPTRRPETRYARLARAQGREATDVVFVRR